jgi:hypothetical protein
MLKKKEYKGAWISGVELKNLPDKISLALLSYSVTSAPRAKSKFKNWEYSSKYKVLNNNPKKIRIKGRYFFQSILFIK